MKIKALRLKKSLLFLSSLLPLALSFSSCGSSENQGTELNISQTQLEAVVQNYADLVLANYQDSYDEALNLEESVNLLLEFQNEENFNQTKTAWLAAREPYGQSEVYRFYNGPIDDPDTGPESLLNAWPLDEAYIDYVEGDANAGIINSLETAPIIDAATLISLNEGQGVESNVSVGYHAVEFLLWGQDLNTSPGEAGQRSYLDYFSEGAAPNPDRRKAYLNVATDLIPSQLEMLVHAWDEEGNNYREEFLAQDSLSAIQNILIGMGTLAVGELPSERIEVALLTGSQEDEHSCFSDNTHRDITLNLQGILNVWQGTYTRIDGSIVGDGNLGMKSLFDQVAPEKSQAMQDQLEAALLAVDQMNLAVEEGRPFDQQIINESDRANLQNLITALQNFGGELVLAASEGLDLNITTDL
ncbi:MAG: hypothetical protein KDK66_03420 [Deltaproteobacteria bacterium]|nr:hypothetical protein [Deltaproteobacteria bacterium]